ncbi:PAS domain S-box-containing protein [Agrobacterium vitis]|nr:PAS domain S-box-containing protein [Agrobacterium vitis]MBE1438213.1 PAS domain S-box-containing protein [Agrobacterium vitis]
MPAIQYPFIDIAVHGAVRDRFARGEALALFSHDLEQVLWANGAGAAFFGTPSIYDLLEDGPPKQDVTFRQIVSMARQLSATGEQRKLVVRAGSGFRLVPMEAHLERLEIRAGEPVILFSMPVAHASAMAKADTMLRGFDDPDTHMALLDGKGEVIRGSGNFDRLGITPRTAETIVQMAERHAGGLMKRPIPTARGYLPAAVGKIADEPPMFLLFAVETLLGSLDVSDGFAAEAPEERTAAAPAVSSLAPTVEQAVSATVAAENPVADDMPQTPAEVAFDDVVSALGDIKELDSEPEDISADDVSGDPPALLEESESADAESVAEPEAVNSDADAFEPAETLQPEAQDTETPEESCVASAAENDSIAPTDIEQEDTISTGDSEETQAIEQADVPLTPSHPPASTENFRFQPTTRAVRFVWKIDALGCFSDISPEFATAVGPQAARIEGQTFADLAALFNLDPDGHITALLTKRDTWSGKTIYWPIEGTSLKVPVDLAALPTYTRNRDFDGFRGFGVVRLADALEDPDRVGLTFRPDKPDMPPADAQSADDELAAADQPMSEELSADEATTPKDAIDISIAEAEAVLPEVETCDEAPAVSPHKPVTPDFSSKIIPLETRRSASHEGLSPGEQAAFREIARKLDSLGVKPTPFEKPSEYIIDDGDESFQLEAHNNNSPTSTPAKPQPADASNGIGNLPPPFPVQPKVTLPVRKRDVTFSPEVLDMLPIALLAHRGDHLIHANPEFLSLTGYDNLDALKAEGGLDALLQQADLSPEDDGAGKLVAVRADGQQLPVSARLQSIRWEEASALLLALVPQSQMHSPSPPQPEQDDVQSADQEHDNIEDTPPATSLTDAARLRVEVEELRSILETATDGVVTISADGEIRSVNGAASALFNYDEADIRGKPFVTLFAHESQRAILDYLSGLTGHGVASVLNDGREVIGREASGGFIPLFMAIGRLSSSNGFCAVIRDITQWKRTEEELRNAKRVAETANAHKSDFLARVSHEIRTPLNAIIGFADIMADERFGPIGHSRYAEYSSDIGRSGRHVLDIVNDLLDISKIEAGEMDMDFISVGLNETVSEAVSLVQPQANAQRVIIRTALSQSVPNVVADLRSIKQIVLNILSNAIRFTPSGGQIIVSTAYESNGSVTLRVRDTGIGMSRSELDQAMKPFRQVSPGGARLRGDGTGLGLPLTKAMADANRASFAIHSTPNEGTLVEITFPSPRVLAG